MRSIGCANADSNSNRNCNSHADSDPNAYAYPMHGEMYANAAAAPYSGAAPVVKRRNPLRSHLKGTGVNDSGYSLSVPSAFAAFISLIFR